MYEHRPRLAVPLMAGVGAAFDFIAGSVKQAPALDAGERAGVVLPPRSGATQAWAALPPDGIKICVERRFGASSLKKFG